MIYAISGTETHLYPNLMEQVHRLRYEVFVKELGWTDLATNDGLEVDQFDLPDAIHHICVRDDRVVGYQRMLPTTRPHLLSDVFPQLCEGPSPRSPDTYELTRYCVNRNHREGRRGVSSVGSELMAGFVEWGLANNIQNVIIEFETIWILRALQLKFLVRPLGYETQIGNQKIVATNLSFNSQTLAAIRQYRNHVDPVVVYADELDSEAVDIAV